MNGPRVLLMTLSERTSAKGTSYMSGFLGRARVVAFRSKEPDKFGNPSWDVFVAEPEPKADGDQAPRQRLPFRGDGTWHRARHADQIKAQAAGEALLENAPERRR